MTQYKLSLSIQIYLIYELENLLLNHICYTVLYSNSNNLDRRDLSKNVSKPIKFKIERIWIVVYTYISSDSKKALLVLNLCKYKREERGSSLTGRI